MISHSPSVVHDGLVFAYDMANTKKSWKGAVTTNILTNPTNFVWNLYNNTGGGSTSSSFSEILPDGTTAKVVSVITSTLSSSDIQLYSGSYSMTGGLPYTVSCLIYSTVSMNILLGAIKNGAPYTGYIPTISIPIVPGWNYVKSSATYGSTVTDARFELMIGQAPAGTILKVMEPQFEQQSFATPFVNGTRSNTQAIVDLTNNNTITANSLTYASDGTFSFNGTTSELISGTTTLPQTPNVTTEAWVRRTGSNSLGFIIGNGNTGSGGYWISLGTSGLTFSTGNGTVTLQNNAGVLSNDTDYHVCGTYDGTLNNVYVNGTLLSTNAGTSGSISYTGIPQNIKIGNINGSGAQAGRWFFGTIYSAKVYNRALTAAEVQQNFNATRSRYGI